MSVYYTGKGDGGETDTMGLCRMKKDSPIALATGDVDELNSVIGIAVANLDDDRIGAMLRVVQDRLFAIGAELNASEKMIEKLKGKIGSKDVDELAKHIDEFASTLPELRKFVLPGGSISAAYLHLARTVARRAERSVVALTKTKSVNRHILAYLNRLS